MYLSILSIIVGAARKTVALDNKKRADSECAAFNFRTKKISVYGIDDDILKEIHQLPFPMQRLVVDEFGGVIKRVEKGKRPPGLISLNCHCLFHHRYLLPCKHIFHEHIFGVTKLLTTDV